jgi:hypothetical protein
MKKPLPQHIHFVVHEGDYPLDRYDEYLFTFKQFFITRAFIPKLFLKKMKEMLVMHQAAIDLFPDLLIERADSISLPETVDFIGSWKQDFNLLQNTRNNFKRMIIQADNASVIGSIVQQWLEFEVSYIHRYGSVYTDDLADVLVSKEPDPMLLLEQISLLENDSSIEHLISVRKELPEVLQRELKRLNLLTQYLS